MGLSKYSLIFFLGFVFFETPFNTIAQSEGSTKITLKRADSMVYNEKVESNARRLIGNVILQQEDNRMYCDSVYIFHVENNIKAYSRVQLVKADSIKVFSDYLFHYGDIKLSQFRRNVVLKDNRTTIYTDSLNYDLNRNVAYYFNGGKIVDSTTILLSNTGYYYANEKLLFFNQNVVVEHENYKMFTDTLKYNINTGVVTIEGPTSILSDTARLYAEKGWYNTKTKQTLIWQNARYETSSQILVADTIFVNHKEQIAEAFGNVSLHQSLDSLILSAHYVRHNHNLMHTLMTKRPYITRILSNDTLYLHGEQMVSFLDTIDSGAFRKALVYRKAQLYSKNIQMRADSIAFSMQDTIIRLFNNPVIWLENMQLTAEMIELHFKNGDFKELHLYNNALIASQHDSVHFDQIKGNTIICYFENRKLHKAYVDRRAELIYYILDKDALSALNTSVCRNILLYFHENQIDRIVFHAKPEGRVLPMDDVNSSNMYFRHFRWIGNLRPKKFDDIFVWQD